VAESRPLGEAGPSSEQLPCRSCGRRDLVEVLDLGETPIANALVSAETLDRSEPVYPLALALCEHCALVQLTESVPGEMLFDDDYPYFSSFSAALVAHSREHVARLVDERGLGPESFVIEVASNDGYLLQHFVKQGVPALGIDPSPGPAAAAREMGVPTICDFFRPALARAVLAERGPADVIIVNNAMAHVPDLNGFVEAMAICLADDGVVTVENPWVRDLVEQCEFDTIYHEHHCYFSCTAVSNLAERHGLRLVDVDYFPELHGGTLRWSLAKDGRATAAVGDFLALERGLGIGRTAYFETFDRRVRQVLADLKALLARLKHEGATIAAYGAAAKGVTLLNTAGIGTDMVDFVVDRNIHKQGKYLPGVHIPIEPVERLLERQPDYVLLLAWNFAREITLQQEDYLTAGGRFIVPVPTPAILSSPSDLPTMGHTQDPS
jgi:hypothetical protein